MWFHNMKISQQFGRVEVVKGAGERAISNKFLRPISSSDDIPTSLKKKIEKEQEKAGKTEREVFS